MLLQTLLVSGLIFHATLAGKATQCGKAGRRLRIGQETRIDAVKISRRATCRYKIRGPPGWHLQLTFSELSGNPSNFKIYDASKLPFNWRDTTTSFSIPSDASTPGSTEIFPTSILAIKPGKSHYSVSIKPVLPEDGDCGYAIQAKERSRTLRSPGWPNVKSPSGMRCSWNIQAREGHQVYFVINALKMSGKHDYLELYEGDQLLAHHSGKLDAPRAYNSVRNTMRIYYRTGTAGSRGFKAKYEEIQMENATNSVSEASGGMRCHRRSKVRAAATGAPIMNEESEAGCPQDFVCAEVMMEGIANSHGGTKITYDAGSCVPRTTCANLCTSFGPPPEVDITMTSCHGSCCFEDLCNTSPGAPTPVDQMDDDKPMLAGGGGVVCYTNTTIKMATSGTTLMKEELITECAESKSCGQFVIEGISRTFAGAKVAVEVGVCVPAASCGPEACNSMPPNPDITVTSCSAECCNSDYCNSSPDTSVVPPPEERYPTAKQCYDILLSKGMGMTFVNSKSVKSCLPSSKCARIKTVATTSDLPGNVEITTVYATCLPEIACGSLNCDTIPNTMPNLSITSCKASCCDGNLCNDDRTASSPSVPYPTPEIGQELVHPSQKGPSPELTEDRVPAPAQPIKCYVSMVIESSGQKLVNEQSVMTCRAGDVCMILNADALMAAKSTIKAKMTYGLCIPSAACNPGFCTQLKSIAGIPSGTTFAGCNVSCCNEPLCNKP